MLMDVGEDPLTEAQFTKVVAKLGGAGHTGIIQYKEVVAWADPLRYNVSDKYVTVSFEATAVRCDDEMCPVDALCSGENCLSDIASKPYEASESMKAAAGKVFAAAVPKLAADQMT